ncbi:hypothetical protein D3C73_978970 [compost metagenome]
MMIYITVREMFKNSEQYDPEDETNRRPNPIEVNAGERNPYKAHIHVETDSRMVIKLLVVVHRQPPFKKT